MIELHCSSSKLIVVYDVNGLGEILISDAGLVFCSSIPILIPA